MFMVRYKEISLALVNESESQCREKHAKTGKDGRFDCKHTQLTIHEQFAGKETVYILQ